MNGLKSVVSNELVSVVMEPCYTTENAWHNFHGNKSIAF